MTEGAPLVLLRHGASTGNAMGLFTGLLDVPLDPTGRADVERAARLLNAAALPTPVWFCSPMARTRQTAELLLPHVAAAPEEFEFDWRLVERNYGALTGRSKHEVRERYGEAQFLRWRRSVDAAPPPLTPADVRRVAGLGVPLLDDPRFGLTESLADVIVRARGFLDERVRPALAAGRGVLVLAHGNSLRAICAILDGLDAAEVAALNLPTGHPLVYRFDPAGRPLVRGGDYLDPAAHAAAAIIAREGGT